MHIAQGHTHIKVKVVQGDVKPVADLCGLWTPKPSTLLHRCLSTCVLSVVGDTKLLWHIIQTYGRLSASTTDLLPPTTVEVDCCDWSSTNNSASSTTSTHITHHRLVLRWVTVSGVQSPMPENLSQYITSHPGQLSLAIPPWVGVIEYQPKGGDALRLGSKGRYGLWVGDR